MHSVYLLESQNCPDRHYVGETSGVERRLEEHNSGKSVDTNKFRPWILSMYVAFSDKNKALEFEAYLESGSGRAFAKSHF